jgi:YlmC/YmxH family sporulation protein
VVALANTSFCELRRKEVVNVRDGARLGCVCDLEIDLCTGTVCAIIVPGPPRFWGIMKSNEELVIPFNKISKIGDDVILVDILL